MKTNIELQLESQYDKLYLYDKKIDKIYFTKSINLKAEDNIKIILKYVFEYYLKWTPQDVYHLLSKEIFTKMKLNFIFTYIKCFPKVINKEEDFFYYAYWLYPDVFNTNEYEIIKKYYENTLKNNKKIDLYIDDDDICLAKNKLRFYLKYAIENEKEYYSLEDIYELFQTESKSKKFLEKYKLNKIYKDFYDSALEYLDDVLSISLQENEFLSKYTLLKNNHVI